MPLIARLILGVVGVLAVAVLLAARLLTSGIGASYVQIEREAAEHETERLVNALEIEARSLGQLLLGWAHWSELYGYVAAPSAAFRAENLQPTVLVPSDLAWVLVIGPDGHVIDAIAAPATKGAAPDLSPLKSPSSPLLRTLTGPIAADASRCGVARLGAENFLTCRMAIRDTAVSQPPRGVVVIARRFDATLIQRVKAESHIDFTLAPPSGPAVSPDITGSPITSPVFGRASPVIRSTPDTLEVRHAVSDLGGGVFGELVMSLPREISALGRSSLAHVGLKLLAVAALFAVALVFVLDRVLVYRLRKLSGEIDRIWQQKDWTLRVTESRSDEIGHLAAHTNALLAVIGEQVRDLELRATTDSLTGLANRRAFDERLALALRRQQRTGAGLGLVMLDLDSFKSFNDRYGHAAGDHALQKVGEVMRGAAARATDLCARLGGEEFAILLEDADSAVVMNVAKHVRFTIESMNIPHKNSQHGRLTISIGVALHEYGEDGESFYMRADAALYRAKEGGRNRIELAREGLPVVIESPGNTSRI
ncbi:diguanylate cyclase [Niveibacterium sp. COAC-50]|uniref:sensor domain-containing diguanylate cyclase n=1 Tax=Niveibacterium sp. COAC-50 TaxID=2729384 RepID=UPI0015570BF4|nr:diguanylate cyclase [Niveibacterium sp. COAC-50]